MSNYYLTQMRFLPGASKLVRDAAALGRPRNGPYGE